MNHMVLDWAHVCHKYCLCDESLKKYQGTRNISSGMSEYKESEDGTATWKLENRSIATLTLDGTLSIRLPPKVENNTNSKITDIMDYDEYQLRGGRKTKEEYYASGGMKNVRRHN